MDTYMILCNHSSNVINDIETESSSLILETLRGAMSFVMSQWDKKNTYHDQISHTMSGKVYDQTYTSARDS